MPDFTRRQWLATSVAAAAQPVATPASRPNVLVVVTDDLGCKDLGYLGASDLKTPNIDQMARAGLHCSNWYSNAPVCAPARASILSGRYPANAGVPGNGGELLAGMPTLGHIARQAGYRTAAIGKWHLGKSQHAHPNGAGFDYFYGFLSGCVDYYSHRYYWGEPGTVNYHDLYRNREEIFEDGRYLTDRITEEAVSFIDGDPARPFLAYVAYNAPHYPMHAPESYMKRFWSLPPERRTYAAMIAAVDDGLGAIRDALERSGRLRNTLILFVGDNGATTEKRAGLNQQYATAGSNGPYRGFKFSLFDGGLHVPAFIHWPAQIGPGSSTSEWLQSMDILPTLCHALGVNAPQGLDGLDVYDVITRGGKSPHKALYWNSGGQTAMRSGKYKIVLNSRDFGRGEEKPIPLWLSNLEEDPGETKNLNSFDPVLADELATEAARWQRTLRQN